MGLRCLMGKRGPKAKQHPQGHSPVPRTLVELHAGGSAAIPKPPTGLTPMVVSQWESYWASEVARASGEIDMPALIRLFQLYSSRESYLEQAASDPMVEGSMGQIRVNPAMDMVVKLESPIARLEQQFGLTPLSRAQLGLTFAHKKLSVQSLLELAREAPGEVLEAEGWEDA